MDTQDAVAFVDVPDNTSHIVEKDHVQEKILLDLDGAFVVV